VEGSFMSRKCKATEQRSFEEILAALPASEIYAKTLLARFSQICPLKAGATVVDIGAAQGRFLIGCVRQGFEAIGIEPFAEAREVGFRLAKHEGVDIKLLAGKGESIPLPSERCDVVTATSVIEHVEDAQAVFNEAYRILKPGGVFWFSTASSVCPLQMEISGFPLFGWYPNWIKLRIMNWAKLNKPHLVGYTTTPAIHWFTPWKARRMLSKAGFKRVYDRWDIRLLSEGGKIYKIGLSIVRSCALTKLIADIFCMGCAYAAVK
jgi:ubiquinone/menaquinone biosynthesis C-methylase UbiE